ncbi:hypothetical protein, partial [Cronobacter sakazakii]|uniref:hypothetical protein n=1 Tax=Cronobacter sakazakii TaxID=28141 RepID=UPI003F78B9FD
IDTRRVAGELTRLRYVSSRRERGPRRDIFAKVTFSETILAARWPFDRLHSTPLPRGQGCGHTATAKTRIFAGVIDV